NNDVRIAVSVNITGSGDRVAEVSKVLIARAGPAGTGGRTRRRAEIHVSSAAICGEPASCVMRVCANNDVGIAISVNIAGGRYRATKISGGFIARSRPNGTRGRARRRAQIDVSAAAICAARIVTVRADNDVRIAIAVNIAGGGNRVAE